MSCAHGCAILLYSTAVTWLPCNSSPSVLLQSQKQNNFLCSPILIVNKSIPCTYDVWLAVKVGRCSAWEEKCDWKDCSDVKRLINIASSMPRRSLNLVKIWNTWGEIVEFRVCKSVHHHTFIWINQQNAATSQVYYLSFKYSSTCFAHPHAHHQELQQLQ